MRKRRNTGKDKKATGCTGLTGKQKHCSRQTVNTVAGLAAGGSLLPGAGFAGSVSDVPRCHPSSELHGKPAGRVCNSGLKIPASLGLWGLHKAFIHPSVTGWRTKYYKHN